MFEEDEFDLDIRLTVVQNSARNYQTIVNNDSFEDKAAAICLTIEDPRCLEKNSIGICQTDETCQPCTYVCSLGNCPTGRWCPDTERGCRED